MRYLEEMFAGVEENQNPYRNDDYINGRGKEMNERFYKQYIEMSVLTRGDLKQMTLAYRTLGEEGFKKILQDACNMAIDQAGDALEKAQAVVTRASEILGYIREMICADLQQEDHKDWVGNCAGRL